jgi:hypothetical protein
MEPRRLEAGEEFEEHEMSRSFGLDISGLTFGEDYEIIEYP